MLKDFCSAVGDEWLVCLAIMLLLRVGRGCPDLGSGCNPLPDASTVNITAVSRNGSCECPYAPHGGLIIPALEHGAMAPGSSSFRMASSQWTSLKALAVQQYSFPLGISESSSHCLLQILSTVHVMFHGLQLNMVMTHEQVRCSCLVNQ